MDLTNKRIMVTGGAGFLGKHVVQKLTQRGCKDIIVPRSRDYDLRRAADIERLLVATQPEIIIHLAAVVGGIGANLINPGKFLYDNLIMGTQLMELSRQFGVEKLVAIGTICSYPKHTPVPFKETDLWDGYPEETNAPYGLAKKMMLVQSQAYRQQYGFNSIYLLPVNLYGPGDNFDLETSHVIPAMIRKCLEAQSSSSPSITLWGDGSPTREFIYADDAAEGIVLATERYDDSEPVNIGSGEEISIRALASMISELIGYKGEIIWNSAKPNGQPRRQLDVTRAFERFGFKSQTSMENGLRRVIEWYQRTNRLSGEE